jgi:glucosamine--fructose-6-phosphate aminotransferase (isomerizing)
MCGIFGYVGRNNAAQIIFDGLKNLEYRGYDSWGIAVGNKFGNLNIEKKIGKIGAAVPRLDKSIIGIGHTRWATHGGVTVANAHPHFDCQKNLALVHNGIVENYQILKRQLQKKGHKFSSDTDSEVIVHLIEEMYQGDLSKAVSGAFKRLEGLNAILVLDVRKNTIVAAKNGSPLVIGIGKNSFYVSSDPSGILSYTKRVVFLAENQEAILSLDNFHLVNITNGKKLKPKIEELDWETKLADRGRFKHFLQKEIFEQPQILEELARNSSKKISELAKIIKKAHGTFMVGCGTASNAALAGQYLFSRISLFHVNFSIGSEFTYLEDYLTPESLIIAFSQSGETMDTLESCYLAKKKKAKIVSLVNVLGSTLYRVSDHKMLLGAGPEQAVCATKSFIAMLSVIFLVSYEMIGGRACARKLLFDAADNMKRMFKPQSLSKIKKLARKISRNQHIYIIGRGLSYPIALEAALKIKEVSYIHSEGFAGGELKHGVIALIEKGTPCIVFAPNDETQGAILSNAEELKTRGGFIIGISSKNNKVFDYWLPIDDVSDASIFVNTVPAQLLAYYLALEKGCDPDKPRNLAKSVTVK